MRTQSTRTAYGKQRIDAELIEGQQNLDEPEIKKPEVDPISDVEFRSKSVSPSSINLEVKTDEPPLFYTPKTLQPLGLSALILTRLQPMLVAVRGVISGFSWLKIIPSIRRLLSDS